MSDITNDLNALADLRDRGVLTQAEFDVQKAALLGGGAAGTAPLYTAHPSPPRSRSRPALIAAAVVLVLVLLAVVAWTSGLLHRPGATGGTARIVSQVAPSQASPPPAPGTAAGAIGAAGASNPLLGTWSTDDSNQDCPRKLVFGTNEASVTDTTGQTRSRAASYVIDGPKSVTVRFGPEDTEAFTLTGPHHFIAGGCLYYKG